MVPRRLPLLLVIVANLGGSLSFTTNRSLLHDPRPLRSPEAAAILRRRGPCVQGSNERVSTAVRSGPPSWVPWEGSQRGPIIETERDVILKRERCRLCSGRGKASCRKCKGKGATFGASRPLRAGETEIGVNERIVLDPVTGLSRAVEATPCLECGEKGVVACQLCLGDGKRLETGGLDGLTKLEQANVRLGLADDGGDGGEGGKGGGVHRYTGGRR